MTKIPPAVEWIGDARTGYLQLIDQTLLPKECKLLPIRSENDAWEAIKKLRVRGAPAIGVAAAYSVVLGCQSKIGLTREEFETHLHQVIDFLASSRPTAVNLFWALERIGKVAANSSTIPPEELLNRLLAEAKAIEAEDREMCRSIASHGRPLLAKCHGVLTHCNTGGLATAGDGTALAVIFAAASENPAMEIYADETRPLLQGARLTAWELLQRNIPVKLICDSMAGWVMKEGRVQAVIVGADRIAANGDSANKIGTYSLSVLAKAHHIPFYVAAPSSTFDLSIQSGEQIPIEQRASSEITHPLGSQSAPDGCPTYNPAFDVAPADNITAIITEKGVIQPVDAATIRSLLR